MTFQVPIAHQGGLVDYVARAPEDYGQSRLALLSRRSQAHAYHGHGYRGKQSHCLKLLLSYLVEMGGRG